MSTHLMKERVNAELATCSTLAGKTGLLLYIPLPHLASCDAPAHNVSGHVNNLEFLDFNRVSKDDDSKRIMSYADMQWFF